MGVGEEDSRGSEGCVHECIVRLDYWMCSCRGPSELSSQGVKKLGYLTPKSDPLFHPQAETCMCSWLYENCGSFRFLLGWAEGICYRLRSPEGIESNPRCAFDMLGRLLSYLAHCRVKDGGITNLLKYLCTADDSQH